MLCKQVNIVLCDSDETQENRTLVTIKKKNKSKNCILTIKSKKCFKFV